MKKTKNINLWVVNLKKDQARLGLFIKEKIKSDLSNRAIKNLLEQGICKINGITETFASRMLTNNDKVELLPGWDRCLSKKENQIKAPQKLYEDDYFIIINKKPDFLSTDSEIQKFFPDCILVHRLDKQTSGVLILAKSELVKEKMKALFKEKKVYKSYIAVVDGKVVQKKFKVEGFLKKRKDSEGKILWKESGKKGLFSVSTFETLKSRKLYSVIRCHPITGRTHQLRVHLLGLGHPILGDYQYFRDFNYPGHISRLMLHSFKIEFNHPFLNKKIEVKASLPFEFKHFITQIK